MTFYDSTGNVVTSGTNLNHLFDYVAASTAGDSGATKATLYFAAPKSGQPTGAWAASIASASTPFPNASAPAPLTGPGFAKPVATLGASDGNLTAALGGFALDTTDGYANVIQVRLKDSGPFGVSSGSSYWSADVAYNQGTSPNSVDGVSVPAGGWVQIYPAVTPKTPTTTAIAASAANAGAGTDVTYTATVSPTPDGGTVAFNDGAGNPATAACASQAVDATSGKATCTVKYADNGTYAVNASYTGDAGFSGSSSTAGASVTVTGGITLTPTQIALAPSVSAPAKTAVTYTATVTPTPDGGTVAFDDGTGNPATAACASQPVDMSTGKATCTVTYPAQGSFAVKATYSGDARFGGSTTSATQTITKAAPAATTTVVTSDTAPAVVGQQVTYTATVTAAGPSAGAPTGKVTFNDGSTAICTDQDLSGSGPATATCQQAPTTAAPHTVTAVYTPADDTFAGSTSADFSQVVNPAATSITVTSSANPGSTGQVVTLTATVSVTSPGSGTPTGTVDFSDGDGNPASSCTKVALTSGTATCAVTYKAAVTDQVNASYSGDTNFASSKTGTALSETVQAGASTSPEPPTGVQATAGDGQATIVWTAPAAAQMASALRAAAAGATAITGYNVFVGTAAGGEPKSPVNATPITGTSYTVAGLTNGTRYFITVESVSAAGSSTPSAEISVTPMASAGTTTSTTSTTTGSTTAATAPSIGASSGSGSADPGTSSGSAQQGGSLPFTGFETTAAVAVALLMVGAGVFLVGVTRNRRKIEG